MKLERTKNAKNNIIFGTTLKIYHIIIPFLMRTAMIQYLGVQYLGLNSLFTSILQVLNLAELGVGSAMVFSMYKPIAEDDETTICALMKLYKIYYRVIGGLILAVGLVICPFVPNLIKSGLPEGMNVYVLYIMNLMVTVLSYWLFAYKNSLLQAHQRLDVSNKISLIINTIQYIIQFLIIVFLKDYYWYLITALVSQITINLTTAYVVNKMYPNYRAKGDLENDKIKEINQRVKNLFTAKLGSVIVNSVDTIVISAFLGLTVLAVYQNYYYILTALTGIVGVIFSSCIAGIGNSIIMETKEKNYNDLKKFTILIVTISGICACELLCLYQPFMELWVGKDLMLGFSAVICFVIYFFVYEINSLLNLYKDAAGIWHTDRFRPLATAMINLILNLITVNFIGIYGVLLSTVISTLLVGMPWLIRNLFKEVFEMKSRRYVFDLLKYTTSIFIIAVIAYLITNLIPGNSILIFMVKGITCALISISLLYLIYRKNKDFNEAKLLLLKVLKIKR